MHRSTHVIGLVGVAASVALIVLPFALGVRSPQTRSGVLLSHCSYRDGGALPDAKCTPGALNHAVTQATIRSTICVRGWTTTVRPARNITEPEKLVSMRQYGYAFGTSPRSYEYDHLIPLELGGAPNDSRNLFPEPHHVKIGARDEGSFTKDGVENALNHAVCAGRVKLAVARREIRTDWTKIKIP